MMPLALADIGEDNLIRRVSGDEAMKKHLEDMGFVAGGSVRVVSTIGGNLIVQVKSSRVALNREMAMRILI